MEEIPTRLAPPRQLLLAPHDDAAEADAITRPLVLRGASLLVNAVRRGQVRTRRPPRRDGGGAVAGFGRDESVPPGDALAGELRWRGGANLPVGGQAVRIAFYLRQCDLYSFWVQ